MYHDTRLADAVTRRPRSAVSYGVGLAGFAGLLLWTGIAKTFGMDGPYAALVNLAACAIPMVLWSLLIDKVHRRASTGIDWDKRRAWRETIDISLVKLTGLAATWGGIAIVYAAGRFYWDGPFAFAMACFLWAMPVVALVAIPYVVWLDRRLVEPRDGAWHLGAWLLGQPGVEPEAIFAHLRAWAVKGFFLAFMLAIVPGAFGDLVRAPTFGLLADPVRLTNFLITFLFVVDIAFATVGYLLTMRPLDAHIRSATPYAAGWAAALICYPPFLLMDTGGPLDYHQGTAEWSWWLAGHPVLLTLWGALLVAATGVYAAATVAFGLRFSNLTHRGILTHGPYAWSRHPAYLSKNLFWWLSTLPILTTGSMVDAARATLLLGAVSAIYYWRAWTEERHLGADPDYRAYSDWMALHAPVPRFLRWVVGRRA